MGCLCGNGLYEKCFEKRRKNSAFMDEKPETKNPVTILPPEEGIDKKTENNDKVKKIKKPINPNYPYDVIIDITSIKKLNNPGWKIIYNTEENIEKKNWIVVSVLGNSNRGKTYLLQKLSGNKLFCGYQVETKGLSLKLRGDHIFLDTAGTNTPLLVENNKKRPSDAEIRNIRLCQILTNYILQNFVIKYADILICVVGMLDSREQIFLSKIKKLCEGKKKLIVIHNLVKCESCEDIEKYKNETLLKMMSCELKEKVIPDFGENKENLFNKYFIEDNNPHVKHFLFANDEKKKDDKKDNKKQKNLEKYNETTLKFIKTCMKIQRKKPKSLLTSFKEHIANISSYVLKNKINPEIKEDVIKSEDKDITPKEFKADEHDNIIFIGKYYEPLYSFYRRGKYFVLEIQICSKLDDITISVEHVLDKVYKETVFIIKGERNLKISNEEEYLSNKRSKFTKFEISQKMKLNDFGIKIISKKEVHREMKYGILYYIYKILN